MAEAGTGAALDAAGKQANINLFVGGADERTAATTTEKSKLRYTPRLYRPADRAAVEAICAETGLRGQREAYFCDRELFVKLWLSPYLDAGAEDKTHCLVAIGPDGEIGGYMIGWLGEGYARRVVRTNLRHVVKLLGRWATGQYRHHPPTGRFIRWMLTRMSGEYPPRPAGMESHMHFNLRPEARRERLGPRMQMMFADKVRERGFAGWHGCVFVGENRPVEIYTRLGMTIGEKRRCTLFEDEEVYFTCLYMPVQGQPGDPSNGTNGAPTNAAGATE